MGKPYAAELSQLSTTLAWTSSVDIKTLRRIVSAAESLPLMALGSGGSLTTAHVLASAHRRYTGRQATVTTPLEATLQSLNPAVSVWLLSAGGSNVDILASLSALAACEPAQLIVMCGRRKSRLATMALKHQFIDLIDAEGPSGRDGFLATNSLIAASALICRAYSAVFNSDLSVPYLVDLVANTSCISEWKEAVQALWTRETLVVLYGPATHAAAIDLESKFTEAALGHVQLADYRNFAHGRHHWLAKRGNTSAVLALSTDLDRNLATKTLSLLPKHIPTVRLDFSGDFLQSMIASLLAALHVAGWAGEARQIDPGRPGVPEFGSRLFRLSLSIPHQKVDTSQDAMTADDSAAIERKTGVSTRYLQKRGDLGDWEQALHTFKRHLTEARYGAIVFDYDGTLVDSRERFVPPRGEIVKELHRFLRGGLIVGVATGRGASVRRDLRLSIPKRFWSRLVVGYYNGAEVATLDCDSCPDGTAIVRPELEVLAETLKSHSELQAIATISPRPWQITLEPKTLVPENRLWDIVNQVVRLHAPNDVSVVRSSHSVDVLAPHVCKSNVLRRVVERCTEKRDQDILKVGDRGRWPGNDFMLLRQPHSISVEEVSVDPTTCWNLAPRGYKGVQVTLLYCRSLQKVSPVDGWRFVMPAWRKA